MSISTRPWMLAAACRGMDANLFMPERGRRRVGASGPRDATAAVSVPQPGVAEHRAEVRPSHSHTVGKRSAGGGPGGDSLTGSAAGTAAPDGVAS